VKELHHALAAERGSMQLEKDALPAESRLVSVCADLVTVDQQSQIIRLARGTTQPYFEKKRVSLFPQAQQTIGATRLTHLSFAVFAIGFCSTDEKLEVRPEENALLDYAARHWIDRIHEDAEYLVRSLTSEFLKNDSKDSCSAQVLLVSDYHFSGCSQQVPKQMSGLHLCAYFGLKGSLLTLLENGMEPECKDTSGRTPLWWAAGHVHASPVKLLLDRPGVKWIRRTFTVRHTYHGQLKKGMAR
jgi:hypothetical protein